MKRTLILVVSILSLFLSACHKDEVLPDTTNKFTPTIGTISFNNQFGVVEFNEQTQHWIINFGNDVMTIKPFTLNCTATPTADLPAQYKKSGTELLVTGALTYYIDSMSVVTNQPVVRYSIDYGVLTPAPDTISLWTNYDYIRIKLPDRVLFFSSNQLNMEPFTSYTVMNIPVISVYGRGAGFYYNQQESLGVTIFDSATRFQNKISDVVKPGNLPYAIDAQTPGVGFDWSFANVRYYSTGGGENDRPDCYFKIVRNEFIPGRLGRTYRIGAIFRCVFKTTTNGFDTRVMGEGQLVTNIDL